MTGRSAAGPPGRPVLAPLAGVASPVRRRSARLAVARHRRLLAAGLVAGGAAVGLRVLAPTPPPVEPVWVAAHDLAAGRALSPGDLRRVDWPRSVRPAGAVGGSGSPPAGVLAGPVRRGEPVTDVRLLGPGLLTGQPPGTVAVTLRLTDPAATVAVRPGARVDVLAVPRPDGLPAGGLQGSSASGPDGSDAVPVASDVLVLALPGAAPGGGFLEPGASGTGSGLLGGLAVSPADPAAAGDGGAGVLLVAVDRPTARALAAAQAARGLTVTLR